MKKLLLIAAATAASALLAPSLAHAQTSAALLIKPWEASGAVEDNTTGMLEGEGHVQQNGNGFQMSVLESEGRMRLFPGNVASPRLGYDVTFLNIHTSNHGNAAMGGIHSQLLDVCVAGGTFLTQQNGWVYGVTLGVGYAGDRPFDEGRAWYGRADFVVAKKFSEQDALGIGLDYDGHRSYLPDTPLPGFGYSHTFDPHLDMVLGFPLSSITWTPDEHWRIYADYLLETDFDVDVGYKFVKGWTAFGAFQTRRDQFYISELPHHDRLLYAQKRIEGGVRFNPREALTFEFALGYAFATDFRRGFDYQKTEPYLYASNVPYLRAGLNLKF